MRRSRKREKAGIVEKGKGKNEGRRMGVCDRSIGKNGSKEKGKKVRHGIRERLRWEEFGSVAERGREKEELKANG